MTDRYRPILTGASLIAGFLVASVALSASEPTSVDLSVRGGVLSPEQRVVKVSQGTDVTLRWTSDTPITIHLHGYDIERKVGPDAPAMMQFRARATGRFSITVHGQSKGSEATLGYVEVHPR